jgi:hypothetical protein
MRVWSNGGMVQTSEKQSTYPNANLSTICRTWIGLGFNPGLNGERLMTHQLNSGMAQLFS